VRFESLSAADRPAAGSSEGPSVLRPAAPHSAFSVGAHVPALVLVLEHEARPRLFSTHGPEGAELVGSWLANAHPEWAGRVVEPALELLEDEVDLEEAKGF
jgi:hypothetical protein